MISRIPETWIMLMKSVHAQIIPKAPTNEPTTTKSYPIQALETKIKRQNNDVGIGMFHNAKIHDFIKPGILNSDKVLDQTKILFII